MAEVHETVPQQAPWQRAVDIAAGRIPAPPEDKGVEVWGAKNDYNARGRGHTYVRRVLRGGRWEWVSPPASRGRFLAADRRDVQYGDVYLGEVIAEYTLGGNRQPDKWFLVDPHDDYIWWALEGTRRRDGQWDLRLSGRQESILTVPDPYWR
jgi:hypothetical protein